jgi:hypothetical protein
MILHPDRWNPCTTAQYRKLGVVVHDAESGDGAHDVLVSLLARPGDRPNGDGTFYGAGYHAVSDGAGSYTEVADSTMGPFHAPPANYTWWAICMPGLAAQTREQWLDPISREHIRGVAKYIVHKWHEGGHTWPLEMRTPAELVAGGKGYTSHNNVAQAWHKTDHTDPGPSFPWDVLASDIAALVDTKPTPAPQEDDMQITVYKLTDDPAVLLGVATKAGAAIQVRWVRTVEELTAFEDRAKSATPDVFINDKQLGRAAFKTVQLVGPIPPGWARTDFADVVGG